MKREESRKCTNPDCDSKEFYQDEDGKWRCALCDAELILSSKPKRKKRLDPLKTPRHKFKRSTKNLSTMKLIKEDYQPLRIICRICGRKIIDLEYSDDYTIRRMKKIWKEHRCPESAKKKKDSVDLPDHLYS